jgi:DNA-directed RNA polymerase
MFDSVGITMYTSSAGLGQSWFTYSTLSMISKFASEFSKKFIKGSDLKLLFDSLNSLNNTVSYLNSSIIEILGSLFIKISQTHFIPGLSISFVIK